jgi:glycosyltransferase involved in cell wall biosynthesis
MANKIAIFYHLYQIGNWKQVFEHQITRLQRSGLYDAADYIHIGVNGSYRMPFNLDKVEQHGVLKRNRNTSSEIETLIDMAEFCKNNPDYKVLFLHAKGVTWHNTEFENSTKCWREYLEYFVIDNWKTCLEHCNSHDIVGTEYYQNAIQNDILVTDKPHYAGNFWWANANYVASLDKNYLYDAPHGRFNCEFWVATNFPNAFNFMSRDKNQYEFPISPDEYNRYFQNTIEKPRLGMISMFKNEAKNIRAMLDSVTPYISYWVMQDNGSTDGTPDIVHQWAKETNIPGFMYKVDEGWVGFGWNRDHVLQTFLKSDHKCHWLMKMDCDETLVIDPDFDWSIMNNLDIHSFHVQSEAPSIVYYRAWIWNTRFPWKFNHDPAHETIAMDVDGIGEGFDRVNLPSSFRMVSGDSYGESYQAPTKYLSDALKLEERMMRENTLLSDGYHFWYIGKSYSDSYQNTELPLRKIQQDEYARRSIFFFREYVNLFHDFDNTKQPKYIDEMSYFAFYCIGSAYRFIGDIENAIQYYKWAEAFCPKRNEHLVCLAQTYEKMEDYAKMLQCTERLIDPERICPFPEFIFIISTYIYHDKSPFPQQLHNIAISKLESKIKAELNYE